MTDTLPFPSDDEIARKVKIFDVLSDDLACRIAFMLSTTQAPCTNKALRIGLNSEPDAVNERLKKMHEAGMLIQEKTDAGALYSLTSEVSTLLAAGGELVNHMKRYRSQDDRENGAAR